MSARNDGGPAFAAPDSQPGVPGLDVQGILERAGADPDAPEGSRAWALAQVASSHDALRFALRSIADAKLTSAAGEMAASMQIVARAALSNVDLASASALLARRRATAQRYRDRARACETLGDVAAALYHHDRADEIEHRALREQQAAAP
jgi:hypothetical protein